MTTIVMNTLSGAVSEYDWAFPGLCATHAGDDSGLYTLGGDDDAGAHIQASIVTGKTLMNMLKNAMVSAYFALRCAIGAQGTFSVFAGDEQFDYTFDVLEAGVARAKSGKGIRENYLGFGYSNLDGCYFELDRIEINTDQSPQRRIA